MSKRPSSKEFLERLEAIWQDGPLVKYQNPDAWIMHLYMRVYKRY